MLSLRFADSRQLFWPLEPLNDLFKKNIWFAFIGLLLVLYLSTKLKTIFFPTKYVLKN